MYESDSFLTLTMIERIGLVCVTLALTLVGLLAFAKFSRKYNLAIRLLAAVAVLYLFIWLSPQVYYLYYLQIFDFLEFKNVIHMPPNPLKILSLLSFTESGRLSHHGQGVLGWMLIALSFWKRNMK